MKKILPLLLLVLVVLLTLLRLTWPRADTEAEPMDDLNSLLPTTAADIILLVAVFSNLPGDLLDRENINILQEIDSLVAEMPGLRGYSSLLSATVVKTPNEFAA